MPIYYRPTAFTPQAAGSDVGAAGSGTTELGYSGLTAGVESQLSAPADVANAHQFFQGPPDTGVVAQGALMPGAEAHAISAMPPDISSLAGVPGAADPVSPMIQLIMKLPGMGAINSLFEALAALFMPGPDLFSAFDLGQLAQHAQSAMTSIGTSVGEHVPISLSLLPANAPILQSLGHGVGHGLGHGFAGMDLSSKVTSSFSEHGLKFSRDAMNVSGQIDPAKAQFEMGSGSGLSRAGSARTELASGPSMSEKPIGSVLAGSERLFSDKIAAGSLNPQISPAPTNLPTSQTLPISSNNWPSSMNVGASPFAQDVASLPAVGQIKDGLMSGPTMSPNVGSHLSSAGRPALDAEPLGPSGAVSDQLGGREILATDIPSYRPTFGGMEKGMGGTDLAHQGSPAGADHLAKGAKAANIAGLKAKQLTLPGVKAPSAPKPAMDHIAHQVKGHGSHTLAKPGNAVDQIAHKGQSHTGTHSHHEPKAEIAKPQAEKSATDVVAQAPGTDAPQSTYTIKSGDNLWNIAKEHLGSGSRWHEIYDMNRDVLGSNPSLIYKGIDLKLPGQGSEIASTGEAATYVVKPGDNLWNIARDHLGGGEHWGEIYKANDAVIGADPRLILPGQELSLPGSQAAQVAASPAQATTNLAAATPQPTPQAIPATASQGIGETLPGIPTNTPVEAPLAQPVLPANTPEPINGAGAAQASPINLSALPPSPILAKSPVTSSLRPDLSFLNFKPGQAK